jgi:hypothetical protein
MFLVVKQTMLGHEIENLRAKMVIII